MEGLPHLGPGATGSLGRVGIAEASGRAGLGSAVKCHRITVPGWKEAREKVERVFRNVKCRGHRLWYLVSVYSFAFRVEIAVEIHSAPAGGLSIRTATSYMEKSQKKRKKSHRWERCPKYTCEEMSFWG